MYFRAGVRRPHPRGCPARRVPEGRRLPSDEPANPPDEAGQAIVCPAAPLGKSLEGLAPSRRPPGFKPGVMRRSRNAWIQNPRVGGAFGSPPFPEAAPSTPPLKGFAGFSLWKSQPRGTRIPRGGHLPPDNPLDAWRGAVAGARRRARVIPARGENRM